jgi:hypothetical protein
MGDEVSSNLPDDWATVDMLAQFTFCPRRFHLMYLEGRWADKIDWTTQLSCLGKIWTSQVRSRIV